MNDIKELLPFVLERVKEETSYPELVAPDAKIFELIDSMGVVGLTCDIEVHYFEPGREIPPHVLDYVFSNAGTIQKFVDMVTDYQLGNIDDDEVHAGAVYEKRHKW